MKKIWQHDSANPNVGNDRILKLNYFGVLWMAMKESFMGKKSCKMTKNYALIHIFQSQPTGWIWIFAGPNLAPRPYIWHPYYRHC